MNGHLAESMRNLEIAAFYRSVEVEALLLFLLIWWRRFPVLPVFTAWIAYDCVRSAIGIYVSLCRPTDYTEWWSATEAIDYALLFAAGIEAWARIAGAHVGRWLMAGLVMALVAGAVLMPQSAPLALFGQRMLAASAVCAALIITMAWRGRITVHAAILAAFCASDVAGYWAIVMDAPRFTAEPFLMAAQLGCFLAWLLAARTLA